MAAAISETERRRKIQTEYNEANGITPESIKKAVRMTPADDILPSKSKKKGKRGAEPEKKKLTSEERRELIASLTIEMRSAALLLEFERAAELRDQIAKLKKEE
jgi:excinuclease ABC subunit B